MEFDQIHHSKKKDKKNETTINIFLKSITTFSGGKHGEWRWGSGKRGEDLYCQATTKPF